MSTTGFHFDIMYCFNGVHEDILYSVGAPLSINTVSYKKHCF